MLRADISDIGHFFNFFIAGRVRECTDIHESQFGFMPGRSTTDAIFILKQTIEQYREGQKDICVTFIDLEKAYDRVPMEESWRKALEERGMRVSRPKTQFMEFSFEQNAQGNRPQVQILGEEVERVTHFKYLGTSIEEEGGMETDSEASGSRVDELEEMQWSVV